MFNRIKKAHEVLTDEHQRAIYDTIGRRGLDVGDGLIISRTRTPNEIREEYARLVEENKAARMRLQTNQKGTIAVRINCTEVFDYLNVDDEDEYEDEDEETIEGEVEEEEFTLPLIEVSQLQISQSISLPISSDQNAGFRGNLVTNNGRGSGSLISSFRKIISDTSWAECQLAVGQGPVVIVSGYKSFWIKNHITSALILPFHVSHRAIAIRPGIEFSYARQLSKHFTGSMGIKIGIQGEINSSLSYNYENSHIAKLIFTISAKETSLNMSYVRKFENEFKLKLGSRIGTKGLALEYGCETKITPNALVGATMTVSIPAGVSLKIRYVYMSQAFVFDFVLNDEVLPSAIFYGTIAPLVIYSCVKKFLVDPMLDYEKRQEVERKRQTQFSNLKEKRQQAQAVLILMQETFARTVEIETSIKGLIILSAFYGKASTIDSISSEANRNNESDQHDLKLCVTDVKVPIQCLVKNSTLYLPNVSKVRILYNLMNSSKSFPLYRRTFLDFSTPVSVKIKSFTSNISTATKSRR